jgi:hypothetical protein
LPLHPPAKAVFFFSFSGLLAQVVRAQS